jgi:CRP-like cAMP-binding protein
MSTTTVSFFRNSKDYIVYSPGEVIFEKGQAGDRMYAVIEGQVEILLGEKIVETVGPDGVIGEMALIDTSPRSATARAKTECKLVPVDANRFAFLIQQTPFFAIKVMAVMAERLRRWMAPAT